MYNLNHLRACSSVNHWRVNNAKAGCRHGYPEDAPEFYHQIAVEFVVNLDRTFRPMSDEERKQLVDESQRLYAHWIQTHPQVLGDVKLSQVFFSLAAGAVLDGKIQMARHFCLCESECRRWYNMAHLKNRDYDYEKDDENWQNNNLVSFIASKIPCQSLHKLVARKEMCHGCHKLFCRKDLLDCSRCHKVQYCSKECQKGHWRHIHKQQCTASDSSKMAGES